MKWCHQLKPWVQRPADDWESLICPDLASPPPDLDAKLLAGVNQYADQSIEALVTYLEDHWRGIQLGIWKSKKGELPHRGSGADAEMTDDLAGSLEESFLAQILRNQDFFTFDEEEQRFFSQPSIVTKSVSLGPLSAIELNMIGIWSKLLYNGLSQAY